MIILFLRKGLRTERISLQLRAWIQDTWLALAHGYRHLSIISNSDTRAGDDFSQLSTGIITSVRQVEIISISVRALVRENRDGLGTLVTLAHCDRSSVLVDGVILEYASQMLVLWKGYNWKSPCKRDTYHCGRWHATG